MESSFATPRKIKFLIELSFYDDKLVSTISDFERYLGFNTPQPDLRRLINYLIKEKILLQHDILYGRTRYKIDIKKLIALIDNLLITQDFYKYFSTHHLCDW